MVENLEITKNNDAQGKNNTFIEFTQKGKQFLIPEVAEHPLLGISGVACIKILENEVLVGRQYLIKFNQDEIKASEEYVVDSYKYDSSSATQEMSGSGFVIDQVDDPSWKNDKIYKEVQKAKNS